MNELFLTGDLHLNHRKIIKYSSRPFHCIEDHDMSLIRNWNSVVGSGDTVIIDGDLSFGNVDLTKDYLSSLNGKKIMVLGDHDKQVWQCKSYFEKIVQMYQFIYRGHWIAICHWCMRVWPKSHYNSYHGYAHSHGALPPIGKSWDVGVDNNNYTPLHIHDFLKIMEVRPNNENYLGDAICKK